MRRSQTCAVVSAAFLYAGTTAAALESSPVPDTTGATYEAYADRCAAYLAKGDNDQAIADCDRAIQLAPRFVPAYINRGNAYHAKGEYDRAIADYNEAIRLDPTNAYATYFHRGDAYFARGEYDRAIVDYSEAMRLDSKYSRTYFNRGLAELYAGLLPKAMADFNRASELTPKDPYEAIWLDLVNKRSNLPSRLAEATRAVDMTKWPAPVIRLYLGQSTPEAVLAAADDPDPNTKKGKVCEANFYTGELALQHGDKAEAARLFRLAADACPKRFNEYVAANAELKRLGATP
jgi:lipoprotein NlpI